MIYKSALRKKALENRNALSEEELIILNEKLLNRFKSLDFSKVNSIHIYLPIIAKKEPNTFLMIDWLQVNYPAINIIVPKADFETNLMSHHLYQNKADLVNNSYHIPEPQKAPAFNGVPEMVIIPLLAFDSKGYRVGYGKGFYDRFLEGIKTQKIGLSFFEPSEEIIDVHLKDIRLDMCITPDQLIEFNF